MHIAIEAKNVSKMLNQNLIINDLSFKIPKNSITLVKGINGVGKSLTLKLISKLQLPSNGNIYTNSKISYAPDAFTKNIKVTVKQFLLFIINSNDQINKKQVHNLISLFGILLGTFVTNTKIASKNFNWLLTILIIIVTLTKDLLIEQFSFLHWIL